MEDEKRKARKERKDAADAPAKLQEARTVEEVRWVRREADLPPIHCQASEWYFVEHRWAFDTRTSIIIASLVKFKES